MTAPPPTLSGARDVIARPRAHLFDLAQQIVERLVAHVGVELRRLDDEQGRRVVVEEIVVVCLVQLLEVLGVRFEGVAFGIVASMGA